MAKDLNKLRSQKPLWIAVNEPVSGSTDPANQDAIVQEDGTIVSNVEGVNNRNPAHLWGLIKLFADIFEVGHNPDGTHNLTNEDISDIADIEETKINFDFTGEPKASDPSQTYQSTQDIINEINYWSSKYNVASIGSNQLSARFSFFNSNNKKSLFGFKEGSKEDIICLSPTTDNPTGKIILTESLTIKLGNLNFFLKNYDGSTIVLDIPEPSRRYDTGVAPCYVVWVEFYRKKISDDNKAYWYGNIDGRQVDLWTDEFKEMLRTEGNYFDVDEDDNIYQLVYKINVSRTNIEVYRNPLDDPDIKSFFTNKFLKRHPEFKHFFTDEDEKIVGIPIILLAQKNLGIYHPTLNPNGTAIARTEEIYNGLYSIYDCFDYTRIKYFDSSGSECPNYDTAIYNEDDDTYTYGNTTYYRSGLVISNHKNNPYNKYADKYDYEQIQYIAPEVFSSLELKSREIIMRFFSGLLGKDRLKPIYYGTSSDMHESECWNLNPIQVIGFGDTEAATFRTNNIGAVFIDEGNNGYSAIIDGVRRNWVDPQIIQPTAFSFIEGNDDTEDPSILCTYDKDSQTVALNTTSLSGECYFEPDNFPIMYWENGDEVQLEVGWTGLGTTSLSCKIADSDANAHSGQRVYGLCNIVYPKGSGTPFIIDNIIDIYDSDGNYYEDVNVNDVNDFINIQYKGGFQSGTTSSIVLTDPSASNQNDFYNGMWLVVLNSSNDSLKGEFRRIIDYNATTKTITFEPAMSGSLGTGYVCVRKIKPEEIYVCYNPLGRGIQDSYYRAIGVADTNGVVRFRNPIVSSSNGEVHGTIITGLSSGEIVDVILNHNAPFLERLIVRFINNQWRRHQFLKYINYDENYTIVHPGFVFETNVGSGNYPYSAYNGAICSCFYPIFDNDKWVGTEDNEDLLIQQIEFVETMHWENCSIPASGDVVVRDDETLKCLFTGMEYSIDVDEIVDRNKVLYMWVTVCDLDKYGLCLMVHGNTFGKISFGNKDSVYVMELNNYISYDNIKATF